MCALHILVNVTNRRKIPCHKDMVAFRDRKNELRMRKHITMCVFEHITRISKINILLKTERYEIICKFIKCFLFLKNLQKLISIKSPQNTTLLFSLLLLCLIFRHFLSHVNKKLSFVKFKLWQIELVY